MQIDINWKIHVDGLFYQQVETPDLKKGDLVLDLNDGLYGTIDDIRGDYLAIRDGIVVCLGVPKSRVRKLLLITHPIQSN